MARGFEGITLSFSGHESFPFRYTWMPKAVRHLLDDPHVFRRDNATVLLGVGKNMVRSIRHWAVTLGVAAPTDRRGKMEVTVLGRRLFGPSGWDPSLEDLGTLWLLHWQLAHRPEKASTWYLVFNRWNHAYFTKRQLTEWLLEIARSVSGTRATVTTIRRDVDVFVRTYRPSEAPQSVPLEDTFDCPLAELNLLEEVDTGLFGLMPAYRPSIPIEVFTYATLCYWSKHAPSQRTLTFETLHLAPGSPGQVFRLSEGDIASRLERLPSSSGLEYDETAGRRVLIRRDPSVEPLEVLAEYYRQGDSDGR